MCRKRPALYWFGDTCVALCGYAECTERNSANWQEVLDRIKKDEEEQERTR
jgi:hypothetical protein